MVTTTTTYRGISHHIGRLCCATSLNLFLYQFHWIFLISPSTILIHESPDYHFISFSTSSRLFSCCCSWPNQTKLNKKTRNPKRVHFQIEIRIVHVTSVKIKTKIKSELFHQAPSSFNSVFFALRTIYKFLFCTLTTVFVVFVISIEYLWVLPNSEYLHLFSILF